MKCRKTRRKAEVGVRVYSCPKGDADVSDRGSADNIKHRFFMAEMQKPLPRAPCMRQELCSKL